MLHGPAYTDNELVILTLLVLMVVIFVVGALGFVARRIYKSRKSPQSGKSFARVEPT